MAPPPEKSRPRSSARNLRSKFFTLHHSCRSKTLLIIATSFLFLSYMLIIFLRHVISHSIYLDIPSLCAINQKLHSHTRRPPAASSIPLNSTTKFSILTLVDAPTLSALASHYPSFLESRSLYASLHGYSLRAYFHRPDARRPIVWSKVLAIHDMFYPDVNPAASAAEVNSPLSDVTEEWVWVLDLDALIFNFDVKLESIIESTGNRQDIDIIIACDHNGLNAGSFFVRKSQWTRRFLRRWWLRGKDKDVPKINKFFEQAVLTDLVKADKSVAAHVHIAPIRHFNAYGYPSGELYLFQTGDFIVHCPGLIRKIWLPGYAREWERTIQECKLRELWMDASMQFQAAAAASV